MKLLYFGRLAEAAGSRGGEVDLPGEVVTVGDVRGWIARSRPELAAALSSPTVRTVVDDVVVGDEWSIEGAAELLFIPPVSGG